MFSSLSSTTLDLFIRATTPAAAEFSSPPTSPTSSGAGGGGGGGGGGGASSFDFCETTSSSFASCPPSPHFSVLSVPDSWEHDEDELFFSDEAYDRYLEFELHHDELFSDSEESRAPTPFMGFSDANNGEEEDDDEEEEDEEEDGEEEEGEGGEGVLLRRRKKLAMKMMVGKRSLPLDQRFIYLRHPSQFRRAEKSEGSGFDENDLMAIPVPSTFNLARFPRPPLEGPKPCVPRACTLDYRAALLKPAPPVVAAPKKPQAPRMSHHQQTHLAVFDVIAKHNAAGVRAQPIRTRDTFRSHRRPRTGPMPFFGYDDPRPFYSDEDEEEEEEEEVEDFTQDEVDDQDQDQEDDWVEEAD